MQDSWVYLQSMPLLLTMTSVKRPSGLLLTKDVIDFLLLFYRDSLPVIIDSESIPRSYSTGCIAVSQLPVELFSRTGDFDVLYVQSSIYSKDITKTYKLWEEVRDHFDNDWCKFTPSQNIAGHELESQTPPMYVEEIQFYIANLIYSFPINV